MIVALLSGGVDSTAMVLRGYQEEKIVTVCVDYGQRSAPMEISAAFAVARKLDIPCDIVEIRGLELGAMNGDSEESRRVVPARNAILLAVATNIAEKDAIWDPWGEDGKLVSSNRVWIGATRTDATDYPDTRKHFILSAQRFFLSGYGITVEAPLLMHDESSRSDRLKLCESYGLTPWSCYAPLSSGAPCGACFSCQQD